MGKPVAKKEQPKRPSTVLKSKVEKKTKKPRGSDQQLKQRLIQEAGQPKAKKSGLTNLVKRNGKAPKELPKPGRYVLAPPQTPSEPSDDSNSEEEEFIDRFFGDVSIDFEDIPDMSDSSAEDSEPSEEDEDSSDDEQDEEEDMSEESQSDVRLEEIREEDEVDSGSESDSEYSSSDDLQLSPSDVILDPDMMMDDDDSDAYLFNYDDCEEIDIESYSESPSSCSETSSSSDSDEYVEGNGRFLDVDQSKINFPNTEGAAIVELDDDSDVCPELVPIPDDFKIDPKTKPAPKPKTTTKKVPVVKEPVQIPQEASPEPADLECYMSQDFSEVLVHLKEPFSFHGLLSIRVIAGAIELVHHTRRAGQSPGEILVMATTDDYPVRVSTVPHPASALTRGLGDPALKRFHYSHLMEIKQTFADSHAVLLLRSIDENHIKFMQGHMSKKILPDDFRQKSFESALKCKFYRSHPKQFSPFPSELLDHPPCSSFPRIVTAGGKNTGKSTLNKCLLNSLLSNSDSQVLYVDLDIGQPEFGVPQTISAYLVEAPVIGKGFLKCHTTDPYYSLVYGHLNVALDPIRYAKCVKALFDHLNGQGELTPIPWVINTMGYVKGVGLDLMHFILTQVRPTRVLQFKHPQHHLENFPAKLDSTFMRRHESTVLDSGDASNGDLDFEWQCVPGFAGNRAEDVRHLKGSEARQMNVLSHLGLAMNRNFATTLNEVEAIW